MSESPPELVKLSEASAMSGISTDVLKQLVGDDLLPHAQRGRAGHIYFPADAVPTWAHCVPVIEERRDHHLRRTLQLVQRLERGYWEVLLDRTAGRCLAALKVFPPSNS